VTDTTFELVVNNVAPVVEAGPDATINAGSTFTQVGSFTDPGSEMWTGTVDYGEGAGERALALNLDKTFDLSQFYPDSGFYTLTVVVRDDDGGLGTDTLTVTVIPENQAPVASNDSYTTVEDTTLNVEAPGVLANDSDVDGDALTAALVTGPGSGTFTLNADGSFSYTPDPGFSGTTEFTYEASDPDGLSDTATVTIEVSEAGSPGDDTVIGTRGDDSLYGGAGDDVLLGRRGNDTLSGGSDDDRLYGGTGEDALYGGSGEDSLRGGFGNDTLDGGTGDDSLRGGFGDDIVIGGEGEDRLRGNFGDDTLDGGAGDDQLRGGFGNDTVTGGEGNDNLRGGFGDDALEGGTGDDVLGGGFGDDMLSGGAGNDNLNAGFGDDTVEGGAGDDMIRGWFGDDVLSGGTGDDDLRGGFGADVLNGGAGNDEVRGGFGNDIAIHTLSENEGSADSYHGGAGYDTLRLNLTLDEFEQFRDELNELQDWVNRGSRGRFETSFGLSVRSWEALEVFVEGEGPVDLNTFESPVVAGAMRPRAFATGFDGQTGDRSHEPTGDNAEPAPLISLGGSQEDFQLNGISSLNKAMKSASGWIKQFVSDLAGNFGKDNPNSGIKITLPGNDGHQKGKGNGRRRR
jgi:Ca2+-binding RTX toxin-like protein